MINGPVKYERQQSPMMKRVGFAEEIKFPKLQFLALAVGLFFVLVFVLSLGD